MLARRSLSILKEGIEEGLFSGAAYALASKKIPGGVGTLGRVSFHSETDRVNRDTLFDVASLTKPLAASMAVLQLVDRSLLSLDADLATLIPEAPYLRNVTIFQLLTHTAGLPAVPCGDAEPAPLSAAIAAMPDVESGKFYRYSDTSYILLGEIVRRVSGKTLDRWYAEEIAPPLHLQESGFMPSIALPIIATMEDEAFDGLPHDPRARSMGGAAGHAGLFMSINDIAAYARALLGSGKALLRPPLFERLFTNSLAPEIGHQSLAYFTRGHDYMPDVPGFGPGSVGHSGFTGCFLLIDREAQAAAALLTNRVLNESEDATRFLALRRRWLEEAAADLGLVYLKSAVDADIAVNSVV